MHYSMLPLASARSPIPDLTALARPLQCDMRFAPPPGMQEGQKEAIDMSDRGNGVYISSGAIALVILVILLIWLL
jgi:hypothetical protein